MAMGGNMQIGVVRGVSPVLRSAVGGRTGAPDFGSALAQVQSAGGSAQPTGPAVDFTHMTRKGLLEWVNGKIRGGEMSLDDSTAFVAMTAKVRVDDATPALDDRERVDFTRMARDGLSWAQQHHEAGTAQALEIALSIMGRYQGTSDGVNRLA